MNNSCGQSNQKANHLGHPCFSTGCGEKTGRIHLAVAPGCNISCNYCVRKFDCVNESRPGVTSKVVCPEEALEIVKKAKAGSLGPRLTVVGIAGPGEPLANEKTFETLELIHKHFPDMTLCLSSNGLLVPEKLPRLVELGVQHLTITLNALDGATAEKIYGHVTWQGKMLRGKAGTELLVKNQLDGVKMAAEAGMNVKVNPVVIPGINDHLLEQIAAEVKQRGAQIHNLLPLIPQGKFAGYQPPSKIELTAIRRTLGQIIPQMSHCQQCRADAIGLV